MRIFLATASLVLCLSCAGRDDTGPSDAANLVAPTEPTPPAPVEPTPPTDPTPPTPPTDPIAPTTAAPTSPTAPGAPVGKTSDNDSCRADAECALAETACCGCTSGGKKSAVRADRVNALLADKGPKCAATMCAMVMSKHESCSPSAAATCVKGKCAVVGGKASAPRGIGIAPITP